MKAHLILAEAATTHPDGTVSLLRAGIRFVWTNDQFPAPLSACLVAHIETDVGDQGQHNVDIRCLEEDGKPVMPPITGQFTSPREGTLSNLLIQFQTAFTKHGRYTFYLRVNNTQLDTWTVTVAARPPQPEKKG